MFKNTFINRALAKSNLLGFTLVELIIFIVVISVAIRALLLPLTTVMFRSAQPAQIFTAMQLASGYMEWTMAQKVLSSFANINNPCSSSQNTTALCQFLANNDYTVIANIGPASAPYQDDPSYKMINIVVTGNNKQGGVSASLTQWVNNNV